MYVCMYVTTRFATFDRFEAGQPFLTRFEAGYPYHSAQLRYQCAYYAHSMKPHVSTCNYSSIALKM